jgi:hypothetical protein
MRRLAPLAALLALAAPLPAHAATRTIGIGSAFSPSVVVVPPGTTLIWRNDDSRPHQLGGELNSSVLQPGQRTAPRVLGRIHSYHYRLADNAAVRGTVIVQRAQRRPARAGGDKTGAFRGSLVLRVNESYQFFDNDWRTTSGACNAEVGNGTRTVTMRANLNKVKYFRGRGHESLSQRNAPVTFVTYAERVNGNTSTSASPMVTCQDGTTRDQAADQSVDCFRDHAGLKARGLFAWAGDTNARFQLAVRRASIARCGTNYSGILQVLGVPNFGLPVNLGNRGFTYNSIASSPATAAEARAIRAGRRVHIARRISLSFTTGCCDGYQPQGEADTRVGTIHTVTARLDINLRPAG